MKRKLTALTLSALSLMAAACNTIEGVGEDTQSAGEAISDTARDVAD